MAQVAIHGGFRDVKEPANLGVGEAAEVAQLDDLGLPRVEAGETLQRGVEREHVDRIGGRGRHIGHEGDLESAATLLRTLLARVLDENAPHDAGCHAQEVRAIAPVDVGVGEAQIGFVDQLGRRRSSS